MPARVIVVVVWCLLVGGVLTVPPRALPAGPMKAATAATPSASASSSLSRYGVATDSGDSVSVSAGTSGSAGGSSGRPGGSGGSGGGGSAVVSMQQVPVVIPIGSVPCAPVSETECMIWVWRRVEPGASSSAGPSVEQVVETVARHASAQLQLPAPYPMVGPDPSLNKERVTVVGYPYWLWVEGPRTVATTVTQDGITITIHARLRGVRFDMGDGSTRWCAGWTRWQEHGYPPRESPTCGYRYQRLPKESRVRPDC